MTGVQTCALPIPSILSSCGAAPAAYSEITTDELVLVVAPVTYPETAADWRRSCSWSSSAALPSSRARAAPAKRALVKRSGGKEMGAMRSMTGVAPCYCPGVGAAPATHKEATARRCASGESAEATLAERSSGEATLAERSSGEAMGRDSVDDGGHPCYCPGCCRGYVSAAVRAGPCWPSTDAGLGLLRRHTRSRTWSAPPPRPQPGRRRGRRRHTGEFLVRL